MSFYSKLLGASVRCSLLGQRDQKAEHILHGITGMLFKRKMIKTRKRIKMKQRVKHKTYMAKNI